MGNLAHRLSLTLGFAVACLHALCGADRAEPRQINTGAEAFLAGVQQTAEIAAETPQRKIQSRKKIARETGIAEAQTVRELAKILLAAECPQCGAQTARDFSGRREILPTSSENGKIPRGIFRRDNPIRAPSAA